MNEIECKFYINRNPEPFEGSWMGAIHKGACKIHSKDCKDVPIEHCYYKQLQQLKQENELLKNKHTIKNRHCEFFEGQTGLCRAKEFNRCNPINCKIYTLDSVSTILELQKENEELKKTVATKCPQCNEVYLTPKGLELYEKLEKIKEVVSDSIADNEYVTPLARDILQIIERDTKCVNTVKK